jgi:hypothetical protein
MAYFNQDRKNERAPAIKAILKKYGVKGSLAVRNHMTFVLNIKSGSIDFIGNYNKTVGSNPRYLADPLGFRKAEGSISVNTYWYKEHFDGKALTFLSEILAVMGRGNHDNSDIQTDYFDVGWYVDVNIGNWDKPYILEK